MYSITVWSAATQITLWGGPGPRFKPGTVDLEARPLDHQTSLRPPHLLGICRYHTSRYESSMSGRNFIQYCGSGSFCSQKGLGNKFDIIDKPWSVVPLPSVGSRSVGFHKCYPDPVRNGKQEHEEYSYAGWGSTCATWGQTSNRRNTWHDRVREAIQRV